MGPPRKDEAILANPYKDMFSSYRKELDLQVGSM